MTKNLSKKQKIEKIPVEPEDAQSQGEFNLKVTLKIMHMIAKQNELIDWINNHEKK